MRIPSVKICENSLKRLEEVKRLVENIEPVEDSDSALSNNIHQKVDQELIHRNSIHQKMNKELAHLKTLLGIAAVTITPQNVNTYTQIQAYADLEDETFVAILAEVEILLKKDMFRIDIYNPQYEDVYVSFINQIKNIAKMLLNQDNIQDSLSDDAAAEIDDDNDALDTAEEKNGVAINIIDIAELNELLENLKCLFEKASIQVTRYNRANVFGRIITVPYGNLQEILREIDMCLASELMQTNQDHRSCKKLYQLRERVQRKIKKNE